jgi:hypothetical protein
MGNIKKLYSFDFDDTLCFTLKPEDGKPVWLEKTGSPFPYDGWWGRSESLDTNVFDIKLNPWVYKEYLKAISDSENFVFMATGRRTKLRNEVMKILDMHNLSFDALHFNNTRDTFEFKCGVFESYIKRMRPDEFIMFDDREEHLVEFAKWAKKIDCKITIVDVINKTIKKINY